MYMSVFALVFSIFTHIVVLVVAHNINVRLAKIKKTTMAIHSINEDNRMRIAFLEEITSPMSGRSDTR